MNETKILLVEDDAAISMGLEYALKQEGYDVLTTGDAAAAKDAIAKCQFALAILDVNLPDGNGYDLCKRIKASTDTAVIFLTVQDEESNTVMGLEMGAEDYIVKPFRLKELLARIKVALRRSGKSEQSIVNIGEITVNLKEAKVYHGSTEILFTATEYRLLLAFLNNRGRILTRQMLMTSLWDEQGEYVEDNTLTVYIKRLREKLGDDAASPKIIQTVRGMGYRMEAEV